MESASIIESETHICILTVSLPSSTAAQLRELSRILGRSKSEIVRDAIDGLLKPVKTIKEKA